MPDSITRLTSRIIRRQIRAALDLDDASPEDREKLTKFVTALVPSMSAESIAYGF